MKYVKQINMIFHFQRGIVHIDEDHYYLIHPLPTRFHTDKTSRPHILISKTQKKHKDTSTVICPHELQLETELNTSEYKHNHSNRSRTARNITKDLTKINFRNNESLKRRKRETFPDGAPAFVETAVFVDKDLFDHMKTNFPVETEREVIRFVLAMINAVSKNFPYNRMPEF